MDYTALPENLPIPIDDGACSHLVGLPVPSVVLPCAAGGEVDLASIAGQNVLFFYPMTGTPGVPLPNGWDGIPGARGCTPECCAFRDNISFFTDRSIRVLGITTQDIGSQTEFATRSRIPYTMLSDERLKLVHALRLPTFVVDGKELVKRLTLIVDEGAVRHVFYPIFPPDKHVFEVIRWIDGVARSKPMPPSGDSIVSRWNNYLPLGDRCRSSPKQYQLNHSMHEPYFAKYLRRIDSSTLSVIDLENQSQTVTKWCKEIDASQTTIPHGNYTWTLREVLKHLSDTERIFAYRSLWFARGAEGQLPSFDEQTLARNSGANDLEWSDLIKEFGTVRSATISLFTTLPTIAWTREGVAAGHLVNVSMLQSMIFGHVEHHFEIMKVRVASFA